MSPDWLQLKCHPCQQRNKKQRTPNSTGSVARVALLTILTKREALLIWNFLSISSCLKKGASVQSCYTWLFIRKYLGSIISYSTCRAQLFLIDGIMEESPYTWKTKRCKNLQDDWLDWHGRNKCTLIQHMNETHHCWNSFLWCWKFNYH